MDVDLQACMDGDPAAWDAFVARYAGVIVAAVRRVAGNHRDATVDDLVQDVFVRIVRNDFRILRGYDPERASLPTWLTLVARSTAIDHLRRRRLDTVSLEPGDAPAGADGEAEGPTAPEIPLHLLSARQRLVLRLLFDEDRTVTEAAGILDVDEQTIRSTKHKALERLRAHYRTQDIDENPGTPGMRGAGPRVSQDERP